MSTSCVTHHLAVNAQLRSSCQAVNVRQGGAEQGEPVNDVVQHEVGARVARPAVVGVVVPLPALDVVDQLTRHRAGLAVARDQVRNVVADHPAEPPQLGALARQVVPRRTLAPRRTW